MRLFRHGQKRAYMEEGESLRDIFAILFAYYRMANWHVLFHGDRFGGMLPVALRQPWSAKQEGVDVPPLPQSRLERRGRRRGVPAAVSKERKGDSPPARPIGGFFFSPQLYA